MNKKIEIYVEVTEEDMIVKDYEEVKGETKLNKTNKLLFDIDTELVNNFLDKVNNESSGIKGYDHSNLIYYIDRKIKQKILRTYQSENDLTLLSTVGRKISKYEPKLAKRIKNITQEIQKMFKVTIPKEHEKKPITVDRFIEIAGLQEITKDFNYKQKVSLVNRLETTEEEVKRPKRIIEVRKSINKKKSKKNNKNSESEEIE